MTRNEQRLRTAFLERDARRERHFVAGVTTTGIYCVASCRARRPRPEHLRIFRDGREARAAGFRPCLRCRPDEVLAGVDGEAEQVDRILRALREDPAALPDVPAVAHRFGLGATRLEALFRGHRHDSVARSLRRLRVERAMDLLGTTDRGLLDLGQDLGWESASAFHAAFRTFTGTTPDAWRRLLNADRFELQVPRELRVEALCSYLARDVESVSERREGDRFLQAVELDGSPAVLELDFSRHGRVGVALESARALSPAMRIAAHRVVVRLLGLGADDAGFARRAAALGETAGWARRYPGLRVPCTATVFDALVLAIVGQQVNLGFALELRRELVSMCGASAPRGLRALPSPSAVAALTVDALRDRRFSRQKAECLIAVARAIEDGTLDLDALERGSARTARRRLCEIRGLGPWSAEYVLMRGFGHADCAPAGDVALAVALQAACGTEQRPTSAEVAAALAPLSPFRSQACFQLWQRLREPT
ncbi:MAG: Ada metal-binding domain-containing protein [Planctomycetota bacterium]